METTIIAFGHKARSGKDTAVQAIIRERGSQYDVRRYSFADALKEEVKGHEKELCKKFGIEYQPGGKNRELLQRYGTEFRRASDPFYWIDKLDQKIKLDKPQFALISDMRFENERLYVKASGGTTVKVVRPDYENANNDPHPSENELNKAEFDYVIMVNSGYIDELESNAVEVFDGIVDDLDYTDYIPDFSTTEQ